MLHSSCHRLPEIFDDTQYDYDDATGFENLRGTWVVHNPPIPPVHRYDRYDGVAAYAKCDNKADVFVLLDQNKNPCGQTFRNIRGLVLHDERDVTGAWGASEKRAFSELQLTRLRLARRKQEGGP